MNNHRLKLSIFFLVLAFAIIYCGGAGDNNGGSEGTSTRVVVSFQDQQCVDIAAIEREATRQSFDEIVSFTLTVTGDDFSTIVRSFNIGDEIRISVLVGDPRNFMIEGFDEFGQLVCSGGVSAAVMPGLNVINIICILVEPTPTPTPTPTVTPTPTPTVTPSPTPTITPPPPVEVCNDGIDNDGDFFTDCADFDCVGQTGPCGETCEQPEDTCSDGFDNDGDGRADCADSDCEGQRGPQEQICETPEVSCDDGSDNDGDGLFDCQDPDCEGVDIGDLRFCELPEVSCSDGFDNDGDGTTDCEDSNCFDDPVCNLR